MEYAKINLGDKMFKKMFFAIFMLLVIVLVIIFNNDITNSLMKLFDNQNKVVTVSENQYKRYYNYHYVKDVINYNPYSYNELINIIYSALNNGWNEFTFYCPIEYVKCLDDIKKITQDNSILTHINNYVHPFNNFLNLKTTIDASGQISIHVTKLYSDAQISEINFKKNELQNKLFNNNHTTQDKIRIIHDYIVENTNYDMAKITNNSKYESNTAYGALIQGKAICSGYADAMAIFLTDFDVPNFKVASETHVWNAVYINNNWYHLDATWDDQIDSNGNEKLIHKFFLINSSNLKKYASDDHKFDKTIYQEFRYN